MNIRDLSIGIRIIAFTGIFAGVILSALSYLAFALYGSVSLSQTQNELVDLQQRALEQQAVLLSDQKVIFQRLNNVTELSFQFADVRYWLADLSVSWLNDSEENAESALSAVVELLVNVQDRELAESIDERVNSYYEKMIAAVDAYVEENRVLGNSLMADARRQALTIDQDLAELSDNLQRRSSDITAELGQSGTKVNEAGGLLSHAAKEVEETSDRLLSVSLIVIVILATVSVIYSLVLRNNIHGPITLLNRALEHIERDSDLVYRVEMDSKDEMGMMSLALNKMMAHFQTVVTLVRDTAMSLRAATEKSRVVVERTQSGADQQQAATEQVAVAMNEMVATVEEVARHANDASQAAGAASGSSREGQNMVSATIALMVELSEKTHQAHDVVSRVSADSADIDKILDVIRGVSEQTNLLALNAAIEAARAGESGRGFAVVADEVRTLAQRTQQSTQEIQEMISHLQEGSVSAETVMAASVEFTKKAVAQATEAGGVLEEITTAVQGIVDINVQIATATEQQAATAEEINRNITTITEYAAETSAGARETNKACAEQIALSEELTELVNKFNV